MEFVTSFEINFYQKIEVERFINKEIEYLNLEGVMIMHGSPNYLYNIVLLEKFIQALPNDIDPKQLKYLSCFGSQMPELIKNRHLYPIDGKLTLSLKGDSLEVYA